MSVSLCVIHVEVEDGSPVLKSFSYSAQKYLDKMTKRPTEPDGKKNGQQGKSTPKEEDEKLVRKLRGRREMRDITVETLVSLSEASSQSVGEEASKGGGHWQATGGGSSSSSKESTPFQFGKDGDGSSSRCPSGACSVKEGSPAVTDGIDGKKARDQIGFVSGNPFVEITKGILHLYKENERTSLDKDVPRSEMICMLAVPAAMTCHDLLQFLAPFHEDIEHVRIIRDNTPNQYMVLVKFHAQHSADQFYHTFNGTQFNIIEPEVCHLAYVSHVEMIKEGENWGLPPSSHTELPTCPVCLERMDESVDGILTILCNHSFHGSCLAKWGDTSCPVCRYVQTPEIVADNRCFECHSAESLWICLICGHVGCGRYAEGHAYQHFLDTHHCYAMQLGNNRVWDYVGDNFVHRLLQNKGDGKLVEVSDDNRGSPHGKEQQLMEADEKLDSIQLEFTYLLTTQLESQRLYFEDKIALVEQESQKEREELKEKARKSLEENSKLQQKIATLQKEKQSQDKKVLQLTTKLNKVTSELQEERQINKCLQKDHGTWQEAVNTLEKQLKELKESKDKEVQDLKEQLRDVMFYLQAQEKIQESPAREEIAEGQIIIGESSSGRHPNHNRRRKR